MNSKQLFSAITEPCNISDHEILSVTEDSRKTDENSVFVCIRGALSDGHQYATAAYQKGCRFFVAEKPLELPPDAFVLQSSNTRQALAQLACRLYQDPSHTLKVIGITGTKGKTTTAQMLAHILNENHIPAGYIGTNGIRYGEIQKSTANTTPDAVTLQKILLEMKNAGIKTVVMEVSSQALKQHRADGIRFDTVIFTNLFSDHIGPNEHPDLEDYRRCKKRLFQDFHAKNIILNVDDPFSKELSDVTATSRLTCCSLENPTCDYYTKDLRLIRKDQLPAVAFELIAQEQKNTFHLPLIGKINAYNALLAVACANVSFGISTADAAEALAQIAIAGRSEVLQLPNKACVIIDYAHNGESLKQLLESLRAYRPSRLLCLFGSVGERTQQRRQEMGEVAAKLCDLCFLTSDNPGTEDPQKILDEIAQAFETTKTPYFKISDREAAITEALRQTKSGDFLVLAGKGHETYQLIGNQKIPFSEKEIIQKIIQSNWILS